MTRARRLRRALALLAVGALASTLAVTASAAAPVAPTAPQAAKAAGAPTGLDAPAGPTAAERAAQVQATQVTSIDYGPYTAPGAPNNPDGTHGHVHTGNLFAFGVRKPCNDCYITKMWADLVYPDGRQAGWSTNTMLHHMVLFNADWTKVDPTCHVGFPFPLGLLFGQRFFASGDERTVIDLPAGFGYRVNGYSTFNMIYELANMQAAAQNVIIRMHYEWVPASTPGIRNVEPIWFDVAQCGFSTVSVPQGRSERSWTWWVNRPGDIVAIGGHIHDGGENIEIRNDSTGRVICNSVAGYGESPLYIDHHGEGHISSMSKCHSTGGEPHMRVENGQWVTIRAKYNMPAAVDDQMGIVMAFVAQ
ncbi:MAG TPA: hypothetical protein VIL36_16430 [Acidimicrobiales bacterium]